MDLHVSATAIKPLIEYASKFVWLYDPSSLEQEVIGTKTDVRVVDPRWTKSLDLVLTDQPYSETRNILTPLALTGLFTAWGNSIASNILTQQSDFWVKGAIVPAPKPKPDKSAPDEAAATYTDYFTPILSLSNVDATATHAINSYSLTDETNKVRWTVSWAEQNVQVTLVCRHKGVPFLGSTAPFRSPHWTLR